MKEYFSTMNKRENIVKLVKQLLVEIGDNPTRQGLAETPQRVARAYEEIFRGYQPNSHLDKFFDSKYSGMVVRAGIPFASFCEHHMLEYSGQIDFAYVPNKRVVGLSKILKFIQHECARLTIQENLTDEIADKFMKKVKPLGCMVVIKGYHSCEGIRGAKIPNVPTITSSLRGKFATEPGVKEEALKLFEVYQHGR